MDPIQELKDKREKCLAMLNDSQRKAMECFGSRLGQFWENHAKEWFLKFRKVDAELAKLDESHEQYSEEEDDA